MKNSYGPPICVTIDVSSPTATNAVRSVAYLDRFDLGDVSANYLGDSGPSPDPKPHSVIVPADSTFVVVVDEMVVSQKISDCPIC